MRKKWLGESLIWKKVLSPKSCATCLELKVGRRRFSRMKNKTNHRNGDGKANKLSPVPEQKGVRFIYFFNAGDKEISNKVGVNVFDEFVL